MTDAYSEEVGEWVNPPIVQPPIYVIGPDPAQARQVGGKVARVAGKAGGSLAMIAAGAVVTAAAFYFVPRLLDGMQSDTVDLDIEGENERER